MSQTLKTDVSILSLADGRRERYTPTARVIEPSEGIAPAAGKGNLYILVELDGEEKGRARLQRELLNTIQETYYHLDDDIPASLTSALRAAHSYIQQYNQYHNTDFVGGVTCLVATGSEIISAQAGPTILAVRSNAGLQWFSPLNHENYMPLGDVSSPAVEIGRVVGHPGVVMVAMNSAWANYLEVHLMMEATSVPRAQAVADQLAGVGISTKEELTLLVVALDRDDMAPRGAVSTPKPVPAPRVSSARAGAATYAPGPDGEEVEEEWPSSQDPQTSPAPSRRSTSQIDLAATLKPVGDAVTGLSTRLRRPSVERRATTGKRQPSQIRRRIPYVLAIIGFLAVVVAVVTGGMWYVQGQQRVQFFEQFMEGARVQYEQAVAQTDSALARQYLDYAEEQLNQANEFAPDHPDIQQLRNQIAETRSRINLVVPLLAGFDQPLVAFPALESEPAALFVNGLSVYVLDRGRNVLERYQLDEATGDRLDADATPQILLKKNDSAGGQQVGDLAEAVWAPAVGNRTATGPLVTDRANQLFTVTEGLGPSSVTMAENPDLGMIDEMVYYSGNLYVLDVTNSQLWRYRPSGESYNVPPEPYFTDQAPINLTKVEDMAIDGSVWLLHPNGTILKFFAGVQEPFALEKIDPPFTEAVAIWANEADVPGGHLYIADAASNRILVFDKSGSLLSQLMPIDHPGILNDMTDLFVDEVGGFLYILTDTGLYQVPLPPVDVTS